jgi:hypothetical protein
MYMPLQMAADLPENYKSIWMLSSLSKMLQQIGMIQRFLSAEPGDYIITARKAKGTENWFVGGITDENKEIIP